MRLKSKSIHNFLKGHMSANILDSFMDRPTPFENGEKMVATGSAITYHLWHKGLSDNYLYKPPSDIDMVLSTPDENERSISNIAKFRKIMQEATYDAVSHAGFEIAASVGGRYDNSHSVKRTFEPDEIEHILLNSRISEVLALHEIDNIDINEPATVTIPIDTMVLDNTVLDTQVFETHPNAEDSALRYQSLSASLAFKIARSTLGRGFEQNERRPGDIIDIYNLVHAHGYDHDPQLLRVMAVVALAQQLPSAFDSKDYTGELLHRSVDDMQDALQTRYGTRFSRGNTETAVKLWEDIVHDVFPVTDESAPLLTNEEDEFIMNFLMPFSGDPRESIVPELLQGNESLRNVFNKHDELAERIKNSTFFQQRITYRQMATTEIEI